MNGKDNRQPELNLIHAETGLLHDFFKNVGNGLGSNYHGLLLVRSCNIENVLRELFFCPPTDQQINYRRVDMVFQFKDGETLRIWRMGCDDALIDNFRGHEYQWIGWHKIREVDVPHISGHAMRTLCRSRFHGIPLRYVATVQRGYVSRETTTTEGN